MTTVREATEAKVRPARRVTWFAFLVLLASEIWILTHHNSVRWPVLLLALASFLALVAGLYYSSLAFKCAACQTRWLHYSPVFGPLTLNRRLRFCPFCGVSLDGTVGISGNAPGTPNGW